MIRRQKIASHSLFLFLILMLAGKVNYAQVKLNGSYVATRICYLSDDDLPDDNILKYTYVKYTFNGTDQMNFSGVYDEMGSPFLYEIKGDRLVIKSEAGSVINTMRILEQSGNKLVLVSANGQSLSDPQALKYILYKEKMLQTVTPLVPDDIFSIQGSDTLFRSGQKIYAPFQGKSFQSYMYQALSKLNTRQGELISTFIVGADGVADSLKIIQSINPKFDAAYIKAFNTAKRMWTPAMHNERPVKVLMSQALKYHTTNEILPSLYLYQRANEAYLEKDYKKALFYLDKAIEIQPNAESLYKRGICKQQLGNIKGACEDWQRVKAMGKNNADEVLLNYCK